MNSVYSDQYAVKQAPPMLCTKEAARFLGLSYRTLEDMRTKGKGPRYFQYGRTVRYSLVDLIDWRDQHIVDPIH